MRDHLGGTDGLERSLFFYSFAIPKYLEYRWHMYNKSPDHVWNELDRQTAARGLEMAYELEGFYVKSGQIVAANFGNAFPQIWQDTMSVLQDQVSLAFTHVSTILCNKYLTRTVVGRFRPRSIVLSRGL